MSSLRSEPTAGGRWSRLRRVSRGTWLTLAVVAVLLVAARGALPWVLREQINRSLQKAEGYSGRVEDVDVHLWRGAYQLEGVLIEKQNGEVSYPLLRAREIDFSLAWGELLRGHIWSEIYVADGELTFVQAPSEAATQTPFDERWKTVVREIFPIDIARLEVAGGVLRYVDNRDELPVDVRLRDLTLSARDLLSGANRADDAAAAEAPPATLRADGMIEGGGRLAVTAQAHLFAELPEFDVNASIEQVSLVQINDVLRAYANVDVSAGTLDVYAELSVNEGELTGYVKPLLQDVDFTDFDTQDRSVPKRLWELFVSGLATIFKNHPRDQLGTRLPISGRVDEIDTGTLAMVGNVIRHAFIQAFDPGVEHSIGPEGDADADDEENEQDAPRAKGR